MSNPGPRSSGFRPIQFGVFEVDLRAGELRKAGTRIKLEGQPFQVLALLLERPGQVVTREELQKRLWPTDTFVDFEHSINSAVKRLREALGDSADTPRFIETLPRRGYRFVAPVTSVPPVQAAAAPEAVRALPARVPRLAVWIASGIAIAALITAGYFARERLWPRAQPPAGRVMLVVLPFENLSGDPKQEYFSDGLTEEMITELGRLQPERLGVIARTSAMRYKGRPRSTKEIGQELGVDYVLEGSVRREGQRVRISAQLIATRDQTHLWAESYERDLAGALSLQKDVARAIADEINLKLSPQAEAQLSQARSVNPEAREAFLRGLYHMDRMTLEDYRKAVGFFEEALRKEPGYAPAYAGLADAYGCLGLFGGLAPGEAFAKAKAAVTNALVFDPRLPYAHVVSGFIRMYYDWDWAGAEADFRRALELQPAYPQARWTYAVLLGELARFDDAQREFEQARRLDPVNPGINNDHAWLYFTMRRYEQATELYRKNLELEPAFLMSHRELGRVYAERGMFKESVEQFQKALALGRESITVSELAHAYGRVGRKGEARKLLAELTQPTERALVYVGLGEKDAALRSLEKAFQERSPYMLVLKVDPRFDPLRDDPRFQSLLQRMNFPP